MTEKIKKILSEVPNKTEVYVFGSILTSQTPNDLDILIVYDSSYYPKNNIYKNCDNFINTLYEIFNLDIHFTVLSYYENNEVNFKEEVKAIELNKFLHYFNKKLSYEISE